jgi:hypothetical protein
MRSIATLAVLATIASTSAVSANTIVVEPFLRGCIDDKNVSFCQDGFTDTGNFYTGYTANAFNFQGPRFSRGFLIFDLSALSGTVVDASLYVQGVRVQSEQSSESVDAFALAPMTMAGLEAVSPAIGESVTSGLYSALVAGTKLESLTYLKTDSDEDQTNQLGLFWLSEIQGALGQDFGVGFSLSSFSNQPTQIGLEGVFALSNADTVELRLEFEDAPQVIPLPASAWLLPLGFGALALIGRRRRQRAD